MKQKITSLSIIFHYRRPRSVTSCATRIFPTHTQRPSGTAKVCLMATWWGCGPSGSGCRRTPTQTQRTSMTGMLIYISHLSADASNSRSSKSKTPLTLNSQFFKSVRQTIISVSDNSSNSVPVCFRIMCEVPQANYHRLLFLGSDEPSSCSATDYLQQLLLSRQTTEWC